ncbi:MAG: CbrC family protein [Acidobacteriia bacterium]|nr:CbrC family protein [Terriglobia bacterium]
MEPLPTFKYHPDPVATGSIQQSESPCLGCNRIRGYIYVGPAYSEKFHYLSGSLCPWCIAEGSAAKRFGATFTDTGLMEDVSEAVLEEVGTRTPGFESWQQEQWLTCCEDAAAFLGLAGAAELKSRFTEAIPAVKRCLEDDYDLAGAELEEFFDGLSKDGQPTAYIFRCLHCNRYLAYVDQT